MASNQIWVEKYRPRTFDKVLGLPAQIKSLMNDDMTHLLFYGTPGTGKTTTAKIIINMFKADALVLNASDERGIDIIRDKVKNFAMTSSTNGKFKIVHLDESDMLTKDAQNSLRNLMETYSNNCRFILTCNHITKVEPAIQSRCSSFEFKMPHSGVAEMLADISHAENITISYEAINKIVETSKHDIRRCINTLQQLASAHKIINIQDIKLSSDIVIKAHELLVKNNFVEARQLLLDGNIEYDVFLVDYYDYIMTIHSKIGITKAANIVIIIADALSKVNFVISKEIIVEAALIKIIRALK